MNALTPKEFQKAAKARTLSGNYLLFGEEEYLKSHALRLVRGELVPDDDPFNHVKISAENPGWLDTLEEQLMSLPMFAEQKLIELHAVNYSKLPSKDLERLCALLSENAGQSENLVLLYANADDLDPGYLPKRPSAVFKVLSEAACPVCFSYENERGLSGWVIRHFDAYGLSCSPAAASALIDYCSQDMLTLASEIDKLAFYTLSRNGNAVSEKDISLVCCGRNIEGSFDFTDALMRGDSAEAMRLLSAMRARKEKPEMILGGVIDTLGKMYLVKVLLNEGLRESDVSEKTGIHAFRVSKLRAAVAAKSSKRLEKALELCLDADLKIKNSALNDYVLLDRLVMRLCRV